MDEIHLPPIYRPVEVPEGAEPGDVAAAAATEGAPPGTFVFSRSEPQLYCAVIVRPGESLSAARRVLYVALLGLRDALAGAVPADVELTSHWPDRIDANGARIARAGILVPEGATEAAVPDWIVLTVEAALERESGRPDFETSLRDIGCDVTLGQLLESFARQFLTWSNRWQDDGFEPIRTMWLRNAKDLKHLVEIDLAGERFQGVFSDVTPEGALELTSDGRVARVPLAAALGRPVAVRRVHAPL